MRILPERRRSRQSSRGVLQGTDGGGRVAHKVLHEPFVNGAVPVWRDEDKLQREEVLVMKLQRKEREEVLRSEDAIATMGNLCGKTGDVLKDELCAGIVVFPVPMATTMTLGATPRYVDGIRCRRLCLDEEPLLGPRGAPRDDALPQSRPVRPRRWGSPRQPTE